MDEVSTKAMWSAANVNNVQQRIISKHLKFHFSKRILLPSEGFKDNRVHYIVGTFYDCYKYYWKGAEAREMPILDS
jgi:hypothetical protein